MTRTAPTLSTDRLNLRAGEAPDDTVVYRHRGVQ